MPKKPFFIDGSDMHHLGGRRRQIPSFWAPEKQWNTMKSHRQTMTTMNKQDFEFFANIFVGCHFVKTKAAGGRL